MILWNGILCKKKIEKFGFGENFRKWITKIYTCPIASIKVNGFLSENINISRGIKQGCPLSALLFILCTEILSLAIKKDENLTGITIPLKGQSKQTFKLSQYADDVSLFLKNAEEILNALDIVIQFGNISGLSLNLNKTEGFWIGSLAKCNVKIQGIKFSEVIKYLADTSNKSFPIIGVGGIHSAEDALEKLNAGADLVQIYTGFIYEGPGLIKKINNALLKK